MNRTAVGNFLVALVTAFAISAVSAMAFDWKDQAVQASILQQNTDAIKELTEAVKQLQINQAVFNTRLELEAKIKERTNGS